MQRRTFLGAAGAAAFGSPADLTKIPIIDTHIHLFDTTRPQGVPWPDKNNAALYKPSLPPRYRKLAVPLGVVGAIKVEASPWLEDNQWVLDVAAKDPIIVGVVGNLEPGTADFAKHLDRFAKNKLFRGIRNGNLWGRDTAAAIQKPSFLSDLKLLAQAGLSLDTANQNPALISAVVRIAEKVPDLRIVIDHLPQMRVPTDPAALKAYRADLTAIGKHPEVFVKLSSVFRRMDDGSIPPDIGAYRDNLDQIRAVFGPDRVLYGSDWPNSDNWKPYPDVLKLIQSYYQDRTQEEAQKFFWKNSAKAYRWIKRDASQPNPASA